MRNSGSRTYRNIEEFEREELMRLDSYFVEEMIDTGDMDALSLARGFSMVDDLDDDE